MNNEQMFNWILKIQSKQFFGSNREQTVRDFAPDGATEVDKQVVLYISRTMHPKYVRDILLFYNTNK